MSFRQNGRYGHVPPAQYGNPPGQNPSWGVRRQPSFDSGDDSTYNANSGNTQQRTGSSALGSPGFPSAGFPSPGRHDELYLGGAPEPPPRTTYGYETQTSSYQQQYQSPTQPNPSSPPAYNPQQFARTYSTSQAANTYSPQPYVAPQQYGSHTPYVPAAYQQPNRQHSVSSYIQSPVYNQSQPLPQPFVQQPYPSVASQHNSHSTRTPFVPSAHAPLPSRPSPYGVPQPRLPMPYPSNGEAYHSDTYRPRSSGHQAQDLVEMPSAPSAPYPAYDDVSYAAEVSRTASQYNSSHFRHASEPSTMLARHPTGRRLPEAPITEAENSTEFWDNNSSSAEQRAQEQIYQDIEAAILDQRSHPATNGDLLDNEDGVLGDLGRFGSRSDGINTAGPGTHSLNALAHLDSSYDYDDEDSDPEAASGLEAMRLAEQEDARLGGGTFGGSPAFQSESPPTPPPKSNYAPAAEESSDSDYANVDMGLYGGGYGGRLSYGGDSSAFAGHSSELEDQSRPLPTPHQLQRNSIGHEPVAGLGGMTDYAIPGESSMHPFPAFDTARVDTSGTGGLQKPMPHRQRLSFDEGDENPHLTESRHDGYSGGESPSRDDIPEMFYHPGMSSPSQRPLPAVPSMYENPTPQLLPAGTYKGNYSNDTPTNRYQPAPDRDVYDSQQDLLSVNSSFVPRSASLSSHSSTPLVVPPVRSRTDAEERQARQRALRHQSSGTPYEGFDGATPQSAAPIDLPALPVGRRRKINPANLRTQDFKRCPEPWALSSVAAWLKEMCGGESGDGESDLRRKVVSDCLIALFTHKVPTMNTADAEVLSDRLVDDMFAADVLLEEEEWVKFGPGMICGVLWQMTGSGCYAQKLHEHEIPGRCYSHHCGRTLKKLDLDLEALEPSKVSQEWHEFYHITAEMVEGHDKKEVQRQNALHEIVTSEDKYMHQLNVLRILYRDQLKGFQPPIIHPAKLTKFLTSVFGKIEDIKRANQDHLLAQLKYRQQEQGPWVQGYSDLFREWVRKARQVYLDYAAGYSHAIHLVRREADKNVLFRQFLDQARDNKMSNRLDWVTYLFAPIKRLQQYPLMLKEVLKSSKIDNEEKANLLLAVDEINKVTLECDEKVNEEQKKVELIELNQKLYLRPGMERVELNLDHLGRQLIFKGDLQRAGSNRFTWLETHAILFDHYLVLAKTVPSREIGYGAKREVYDVSKLPIPMQLLVLESTSDEAVVKSKGLAVTTSVRPETRTTRSLTGSERPTGGLQHTDTGSSTASSTLTKTVTSTNLENDARMMFPFRVKHLGKSEVYTLYAPTAGNRADWCKKIVEAKERHAASLFQQNAEPFKLRVMADSAFAYDAASAASQRGVIPIRGTPLDRAIREMETEYGPVRPGPVCRAMVNCATTFTCYGKTMVAIGTDYGVYVAEASSPRGWTRSIMINRVTQISIIEEFSLCLIIADKSLIAYSLDLVVPPSSAGGYAAPPVDTSSSRKAPQKISGTRDVGFFATARMKDRTLIFYKKREGLSSTFKVLEPVFQKSSERKTRLLSRSRLTGSSSTEFFREFDEFYIPSDCFTINLFHTYIAISTAKGFELLTLDRKAPMSIPDLKQPATATIASRLAGQRPLGMFRLSEAEFLLCYEECGVYISKHGEVSRSVVLEFVGRATSATLFGAYLVLFDNDFVEVRNAENGRLRQLIAGKDVRCLDYGAQGEAGTKDRNLKIAMAHPEIVGCQLVLELVLNDGIKG